VIGYCIRTDRYGETTAIGTPGEANMYAIHRLTQNPELTADEILTDYLNRTYGKKATPLLKPVFEQSFDLITSVYYVLGTHQANHSRLNFHRSSNYTRHASGKWYPRDSMVIKIRHGVNKEFHYWKDIINTITPAQYKGRGGKIETEVPWVLQNQWLDSTELMNMEYLGHIITEKDYGVQKAEELLATVEKTKTLIADTNRYNILWHTLNRTVIIAKSRRGNAKAIYGYRVWSRGKKFQTRKLRKIIWDGLEEACAMAEKIDNYPIHVQEGAWKWKRDVQHTNEYFNTISTTGWKEFGIEGITVPKP
jgi:hypothetical protein